MSTNLSTGADEAGNARYLHASWDSWGSLMPFHINIGLDLPWFVAICVGIMFAPNT